MEHFGRKLLIEAGIHKDRFALDWASAAEAPLYVKLIKKFTEQVKKLGPLGDAEGFPWEELEAKLIAAKAAATNRSIRTRFGKLTQDLRKENDYSSNFIESKVSEKLFDAITREMEKHA